jgi:glutathione S-transferase
VKAKRLSGDTWTAPVPTLDERSIGDSTRTIAEIEEHWPQQSLYPEDAVQRRRALELAEFFDEELGPHVRRACYHELLRYPELVLPPHPRPAARGAGTAPGRIPNAACGHAQQIRDQRRVGCAQPREDGRPNRAARSRA